MATKGKANRIGVYIIVGLICFAMIGFGATNFGGSVNAIGQVGDRDISAQRYYNAVTSRLRQFSQQTGTPITFQQAQAFGLDQVALQELIATVALEAEAAAQGISAGDAVVRDEILVIPGFQGLDGRFDREAYAQVLRRNGLTERQFENDLRAEISRTILQGAVASGVAAPSTYTDALIAFVGERRSFTYVVLDETALTSEVPEPTDEELRSYFAENDAAFMLPETRAITYAWLTPAMMTDNVVLEEADLRAAYEARLDEFVVPERRLVERLILGAAADGAKARLDAGEITFEDLVAERGLELVDIDLGDVTEADLNEAGPAIFAATDLGVVGPVDTPLGAALFRVNAILSAQETTFEEALPLLEEEIALVEAEAMINDEIEVVDDLLAGGATLEELAAETDMELGQINWTPGAEGDIADYAAFRTAAATVRAGDFPEVESLDDGGLFALRLDEVIAPRVPEFDDVRDDVAAAWRANAVIEALTAQAAVIESALAAGDTPEGVTVQTETALTRDAFVSGGSPDLLTEVFEIASANTIRILPGTTTVEIVRLDEILPPDPEDETLAEQRVALEAATSQAIGTDILGAFAAAVQAEIGIRLDQAALQAVHVNIP